MFLGSLYAVTTSGRTAVLVQAAAFGLLHLSGFPGGAVGVGLAAVYGVMLGVLRRRAGGLLAPYVAHVAADLTVFVLLLTWMRWPATGSAEKQDAWLPAQAARSPCRGRAVE